MTDIAFGQFVIVASLTLLLFCVPLAVAELTEAKPQPAEPIETPKERHLRRKTERFIRNNVQTSKFGDKRRRTSHTTKFLA